MNAHPTDAFIAWNADRTKQYIVQGKHGRPRPGRMQQMYLDPAKWTPRARLAMAGVLGPSTEHPEPTDEPGPTTAYTVLSADIHGFKCMQCGSPAITPSCSVTCHASFIRETHQNERKLEIRDTGNPALGLGVFVQPSTTTAAVAIPRSAVLGEYIGELLPPELTHTASRYLFDVADSEGDGDGACIDGEARGNWTRFVNHACAPNLEAVDGVVGGRRAVVFRARRNLVAGEQLSVAYGREYFEAAGLRCVCPAMEVPHLPPP